PRWPRRGALGGDQKNSSQWPVSAKGEIAEQEKSDRTNPICSSCQWCKSLACCDLGPTVAEASQKKQSQFPKRFGQALEIGKDQGSEAFVGVLAARREKQVHIPEPLFIPHNDERCHPHFLGAGEWA